MADLIPGGYNDPNAKGNRLKKWKRPRLRCNTQPCDEVPGTAWSPYWCFRHNVERIDGISESLDRITNEFAERKEQADG